MEGFFQQAVFFFAMGLNRAFRRAEIADTWLRFGSLLGFVAVGAMVLMMVGGFLWLLSLVLGTPTNPSYSLLPFFLGMCVAVLVAVHALFSRPSKIASTRFSRQSRARFMIQKRHYMELVQSW